MEGTKIGNPGLPNTVRRSLRSGTDGPGDQAAGHDPPSHSSEAFATFYR